MWLLSWVAYPVLSVGLQPVDAGLLRIAVFMVGLFWEFVLSMLILCYEEGNIRPRTISRRSWLNHPVSPKTGETRKALWRWIIPLIVLVGFLEKGLEPVLVQAWTAIFLFFTQPKGYDMSAMFLSRV